MSSQDLTLSLRPFHKGARFSLFIFERSEGDSPVADFLGGLSGTERARFAAHFERVADHGPLYNPGKSVPIAGHDFLEFKSGQQRIFWCYASGSRIVLLHGFTKKSNRTPRRELRAGCAATRASAGRDRRVRWQRC
ncbi:MAG: type II toxin-antitoxin system RelE/ParE family toxin [Chloroflexi bacterium]|nr:type II toxin-antitoxin system RelE/ParE family toxin [Chloroflexota bacterium]